MKKKKQEEQRIANEQKAKQDEENKIKADQYKVEQEKLKQEEEAKKKAEAEKPKSKIDLAWEALDKSIQTRKGYDIKFDEANKTITIFNNGNDKVPYTLKNLILMIFSCSQV